MTNVENPHTHPRHLTAGRSLRLFLGSQPTCVSRCSGEQRSWLATRPHLFCCVSRAFDVSFTFVPHIHSIFNSLINETDAEF